MSLRTFTTPFLCRKNCLHISTPQFNLTGGHHHPEQCWRLAGMSTLINYSGLFYSLLWIELKQSLEVNITVKCLGYSQNPYLALLYAVLNCPGHVHILTIKYNVPWILSI